MRVGDIAAQRDSEDLVRFTEARCPADDGACDQEVGATIGHASELPQDASRMGKRFVDIPERTGPPHA